LKWFKKEKVFRLRDEGFAGLKAGKNFLKNRERFGRKLKRPYLCRPKIKMGLRDKDSGVIIEINQGPRGLRNKSERSSFANKQTETLCEG
jgi:hypothetical protein